MKSQSMYAAAAGIVLAAGLAGACNKESAKTQDTKSATSASAANVPEGSARVDLAITGMT